MHGKGFRKITAIFTAICMVISMFAVTGPPVTSWADDPPGDESDGGGEGPPWAGSGTSGDPYLISDDTELVALSDPEYSNCWGAYFEQTANITLPAITSGSNWTPIGDDWSNSFTGTYDGGGYTISNLTIDDDELEAVGLFGFVGEDGALKNIVLEDVDITSTLEDEWVYAGGLAGNCASANVLIEHCSVNGSVQGASTAQVGGLAGSSSGTIRFSSSGGTVRGTGNVYCVGGIAGFNYGSVEYSFSTADVTVGNNTGTAGTGTYAGGLIGTGYGASNCYSTGSVTAGSGTGGEELGAGGLVGYLGSSVVENCYSAGSVSGGAHSNLGGLVGILDYGEISGSYFDSESLGWPDTSGNGAPRTTAQMMQESTFIGWDFGEVWYIADSVGYPVFLRDVSFEPGEAVAQAAEKLTWNTIRGSNYAEDQVTGNLNLPGTGHFGTTITWESNDTDVIELDGTVNRPDDGDDVTVTMTAIVSKDGTIVTETKEFGLTVLAELEWETETIDSETFYKVSSLAHLYEMRGLMEAEDNWGLNFIQTANITLPAVTPGTSNWEPLGDYNTPFYGTYDGGDSEGVPFTISNLTIYDDTNQYVGLFGYTDHATLRKIVLENVSVYGGDETDEGYLYVGGLAGYMDRGTVYDSVVNGSVSGGDGAYAGGIAGYAEETEVMRCSVSGSVTGGDAAAAGGLIGYQYGGDISGNDSTSSVSAGDDANAGGLIGKYEEYDGSEDSVTWSLSTGDVSGGDDAKAGGLIGCRREGAVIECASTGDVSVGDNDYSYAGGLIGDSSGGDTEACYSVGAVTGGEHASAGGLIGYLDGGTVVNCYAVGTVEAGDYAGAGGFVGYDGSGTIRKSFAVAAVYGRIETNTGGFVGGGYGDSADDSCCYDSDVSGLDESYAGTPLPTEAMMTAATFTDAGWDDFTDIWDIEEGETYPWLQWQNSYTGLTEADRVSMAAAVLGWQAVKGSNRSASAVASPLTLPADWIYGTTVSWGSSNISVIENNGTVHRPGIGEGNETVTLTATIGYGGVSQTKELPLTVAAGPDWTGKGTGTENDPYQVSSPEHLDDVRNLMGEGVHFRQGASIDLSGFAEWTPIGDGNEPFAGVYNGNGCTISGLRITNNLQLEYVGLFGCVGDRGSIMGVILENAAVTLTNENEYVGGLVGLLEGGIVTGSSISGSVTGNGEATKVGGLVGGIYSGDTGEGVVEDCNSSVTITADGEGTKAGGLTGSNYHGTVTNSTSSGDVRVSSDNSYAGGLIGENPAGTVTNSTSSGDVTVSGDNSYAGGLVGGNSSGTVANSTSSGIVAISGNDSYAGGLLGYNDYDAVTGCRSTGTVTGSGGAAVGGLIGDDDAGIALTDISLDTSDAQTQYMVGEPLNVTGLKVMGAYASNNTAVLPLTIAAGDVSGFDSGAVAAELELTVTLEYQSEDYTDTYTVSINPFVWGAAQDGSGNHPYEVSSAAHLNAVRTDLDAHYIQTASIDLEGVNWTPIGTNYPASAQFTGVYDGNGYTISNLTIDSDSLDYVGLFGYVGGDGAIQGVTLEGVDISASRTSGLWAGALAAFNAGSISGGGSTGSIAYSGGAPYYTTYIGGLAGYNSGTVEGSYSACGIEAVSDIRISVFAGGLAGSNGGAIRGSYSTGGVDVALTNAGQYVYAGGLAGASSGDSAPVENSYSTGDVTATVTPAGEGYAYAGGLVGNKYGDIANTYSTGSVTAGGTVQGGGLIGCDGHGSLTASYYLETAALSSDGGEPLSAAELAQQAQFSGWDFDAVWKIGEGVSSPTLRWQQWTPDEQITADRAALAWDDIKGANSAEDNITADLTLPAAGTNGSAIAWSADPAGYINTAGGAVTRPAYGAGDKTVTLSAIVSKTGGTSQTREFTLTVKEASYSGGNDNNNNSNSGGDRTGSGTPPPVQDTAESITTQPTLNQSTGIAGASINNAALNAALEKAVASGGIKTVGIEIPKVSGASGYEATLPAGALASSDTNTQIQIKTDIADMTLPGNMIPSSNAAGASNVSLTVARADLSGLDEETRDKIGDRPVIQITLSIDGQQTDWNNPDAPVTLAVPYTPTAEELANPEGIVVWYIDGSGNAVSVPNGRYDPVAGTVTVSVTHFSDYAVVYNSVSFSDVAATAWYSKAVSFIAAREITTGTGNGNFSPGAKLTRGQFIVMLMKTYEIAPDVIGSGGSGSAAEAADNFSDAGNTYYTGYLAAAKRLGISGGVGNNQFAPEKQITRQEMFTLLYNALKAIGRLPEASRTSGGSGRTISDFSDADQVASWAKDAMTLLVETGTIAGSGGKLSPAGTTTRAEMAQVLYNLVSK